MTRRLFPPAALSIPDDFTRTFPGAQGKSRPSAPLAWAAGLPAARGGGLFTSGLTQILCDANA